MGLEIGSLLLLGRLCFLDIAAMGYDSPSPDGRDTVQEGLLIKAACVGSSTIE